MNKQSVSLIITLVSNLFPLYGLFYLNWSPFDTVIIFLIETFILFFYYLVKAIILMCQARWAEAIPVFLGLIFSIVFSTIQLILTIVMFLPDKNPLPWAEIIPILTNTVHIVWLGILVMFVKYFVDLVSWVIEGYKDILSSSDSDRIGGRIMFMQFVIIFGGALSKITGSAALGASLFVISIAIYSIYKYRDEDFRRKRKEILNQI